MQDPGQQQLAKVYAKALLGAAETAGVVDELNEQLHSLVFDVLAQLPRLNAALCSPRVADGVKLKMLDDAFSGKMDGTLLRFLKVLCRRRRMELIRAIAIAYEQLFHEMKGIVQVHVETATDVNEEMRQSMQTRLSEQLGQQVLVRTRANPDLIGGMVVRVGDTVFDGSLANRLRSMREHTVDSVAQLIRESGERFVAE